MKLIIKQQISEILCLNNVNIARLETENVVCTKRECAGRSEHRGRYARSPSPLLDRKTTFLEFLKEEKYVK